MRSKIVCALNGGGCDEDGVVAGDGADGFFEIRGVDGVGDKGGVTRGRPDDDHRRGGADGHGVAGDDRAEHVLWVSGGRVDVGREAVAGWGLDGAESREVAGNGALSCTKPFAGKSFDELLLRRCAGAPEDLRDEIPSTVEEVHA